MQSGSDGFAAAMSGLGLSPRVEAALVICRVTPVAGARAGSVVEVGVALGELSAWAPDATTLDSPASWSWVLAHQQRALAEGRLAEAQPATSRTGAPPQRRTIGPLTSRPSSGTRRHDRRRVGRHDRCNRAGTAGSSRSPRRTGRSLLGHLSTFHRRDAQHRPDHGGDRARARRTPSPWQRPRLPATTSCAVPALPVLAAVGWFCCTAIPVPHGGSR